MPVSLLDLLASIKLDHLESTLSAGSFELAEAAAVLEQVGRPKLLAHIKAAGVASLAERQALCGAISKALKAGDVKPDHAVGDGAGQLLGAASRGDEDGVQAALRAGVVSGRDARGNTPCMAAAEGGHAGVVRVLLEAGAAEVDAQRPDGASAVMLATKGRRHGCIALLLGAAADANLVDREHWSALMHACEADDERSVELLLGSGAFCRLLPPSTAFCRPQLVFCRLLPPSACLLPPCDSRLWCLLIPSPACCVSPPALSCL